MDSAYHKVHNDILLLGSISEIQNFIHLEYALYYTHTVGVNWQARSPLLSELFGVPMAHLLCIRAYSLAV
jgi:hypothetical protein